MINLRIYIFPIELFFCTSQSLTQYSLVQRELPSEGGGQEGCSPAVKQAACEGAQEEDKMVAIVFIGY